jgi:hypothetical protein
VLNGMRNTLNAQVYAFKEANFLCVSGTHGPAHLALYDQATWDKYQLAKLAGGNISSNTFIVVPAAASHDPTDIRSTDGAFSPKVSRCCSGAASCSWLATTRSGSLPTAS